MGWTSYTPSFDVVAKNFGMPLPKAISKLWESTQACISKGTLKLNDALCQVAEKTWHELGRPSYRVALPLAEALTETDLDIDAAFIRFPQVAFALELPRELQLLNANGHRLNGLLVTAMRELNLVVTGEGVTPHRGFKLEVPDGEGPWRIFVLQCWDEEDGVPADLTFPLAPGTRVGQKLDEVLGNTDHDHSITTRETTRRFLALALGAALFAVGANARFIKPLGRSNGTPKRRGRRADRRAPEPRRWVLGADIQLPRGPSPGSPSRTDDELVGRELSWAHIRQGHLRMTPCGPQDDRRYVLRYIAPTIVRADLPLAPQATRHAMDKPTRNKDAS